MSSLPKSKPRTVYAWRVVDCDPDGEANGWVNENPGVVFFGNDGRARMGSPHTIPNGRRLWKFADAEFPRGLRYDEILATRYYLPVFEPQQFLEGSTGPFTRTVFRTMPGESEEALLDSDAAAISYGEQIDALQDFLQALHTKPKPKLTLAERMMRLKCYQVVPGMAGTFRESSVLVLQEVCASECRFRLARVGGGLAFTASAVEFTPDPHAPATMRILREWLGGISRFMIKCPEIIIERLEQRDGVA